jgi:hypothetical protein
MREDRRHTCADAVALDNGRMSDAHPLDIGDRIQGTWRVDAGRDAQVASARLGLRGHRRHQGGGAGHCGKGKGSVHGLYRMPKAAAHIYVHLDQ